MMIRGSILHQTEGNEIDEDLYALVCFLFSLLKLGPKWQLKMYCKIRRLKCSTECMERLARDEGWNSIYIG